MLRIGLIGFGYWGPNIARNLKNIGADLSVIIDTNINSIKKIQDLFPNIRTSINYELDYDLADAFIIATPIHTHYKIAKFLLEKNKHVLIQKPMCDSVEDCIELVNISQSKNLVLMVAHTFLFSSSIIRIKQDIDNNKYGTLNYLFSTRINLGLFQRQHNVLWDLLPHDFSIIRYLIKEKPKYISATGKSHVEDNNIDCANISLIYESNFMANININWLSPLKVRNIILGGSEKTVVYDDCSLEKVKIYDAGVHYNQDVFTYTKGDIYVPKLSDKEAIGLECLEFINAIKESREHYISDGLFGLEIVKMINAANQSILNNGEPICL